VDVAYFGQLIEQGKDTKGKYHKIIAVPLKSKIVL
jgi:hypothetical protein